MKKEKLIKVNEVKKLDIKKGDTIVIRRDLVDDRTAYKISKTLKCGVILLDDLDGIGILKTSKFNK